MKRNWLVTAGFVTLVVGGYWFLGSDDPIDGLKNTDRPAEPMVDEKAGKGRARPDSSQAVEDRSPEGEGGLGEAGEAAAGKSISQQEPSANPDIKYVDGVQMIRSYTRDGEEVWVPTAPGHGLESDSSPEAEELPVLPSGM